MKCTATLNDNLRVHNLLLELQYDGIHLAEQRSPSYWHPVSISPNSKPSDRFFSTGDSNRSSVNDTDSEKLSVNASRSGLRLPDSGAAAAMFDGDGVAGDVGTDGGGVGIGCGEGHETMASAGDGPLHVTQSVQAS